MNLAHFTRSLHFDIYSNTYSQKRVYFDNFELKLMKSQLIMVVLLAMSVMAKSYKVKHASDYIWMIYWQSFLNQNGKQKFVLKFTKDSHLSRVT